MDNKFKKYGQPWLCERCNKSGAVGVFFGDDVFSIINRIEDSHKKLSPECNFDVDKVSLMSIKLE